jgi:two-component system chemotaxis sensor kinase CheA
LLGMVRSGHAAYSRGLADQLLEAMDLVGVICGDIESTELIDASRAAESQHMADALRKLMPGLIPSENAAQASGLNAASSASASSPVSRPDALRSGLPLGSIPEAVRMAAFLQCQQGDPLHWIAYRPQRECFFHGDDPLNSARQAPGLLWGHIVTPGPLPALAELDTYSCLLGFDLLSNASREELDQYYRYLPDQVEITAVHPQWLVSEQGETDAAKFTSSITIRQFSDDDRAALEQVLAAQRQILLLDDRPAWHAGRLKAVAEVLANLSQTIGVASARTDLQAALAEDLSTGHNTLLLAWLDAHKSNREDADLSSHPGASDRIRIGQGEGSEDAGPSAENGPGKQLADQGIKFGRRAEDAVNGPKSLKVDQAKIDRLMNLIGELVVSKNGLPYLAERAESQFGVRELSREIKSQYSIINRIADEM